MGWCLSGDIDVYVRLCIRTCVMLELPCIFHIAHKVTRRFGSALERNYYQHNSTKTDYAKANIQKALWAVGCVRGMTGYPMVTRGD